MGGLHSGRETDGLGEAEATVKSDVQVPLNAICPYFTMFPLEFPLGVLRGRSELGEWVLDPFCGRGTTALAARILGLRSVGIDSHPLAAALTQAKLVDTTPSAILRALDGILRESTPADCPPRGDFWRLAFEARTLASLVRIRTALLRDCRSAARVALRGILLGALHGPRTRGVPSYLSNQSPRTYAPKPRYAVRYWRREGLRPAYVDLRSLVARRAAWYYGSRLTPTDGFAIRADSRQKAPFRRRLGRRHKFKWIVTSPPYYGMRTYRPDQWLRLWFLGGPSHVDYSQHDQLQHGSPDEFAEQLNRVWRNCAAVAASDARLVVRFGSISDRSVTPWDILQASLAESGWRVTTRRPAGTASRGRRQADHFGVKSVAQQEFDVWALLG